MNEKHSVGTTTGGDGIGIDPCIMSLPNSSLVIQFTMDMGLNPDATANEETHTAPDIYIEQSKKDYLNFLKWHRRHKGSNNLLNTYNYDTVLNSVIQKCK